MRKFCSVVTLSIQNSTLGAFCYNGIHKIKYNRLIPKLFDIYLNFIKKLVLPDSWNAVDTVEDWDNEEYTGSLADTKVFTPSSLINEVSTSSDKSEKEEQMSAIPVQSTNLIISNVSIEFRNKIFRLI